MDGLPEVDEDDALQQELHRQKRSEAKEARVREGLDPAIRPSLPEPTPATLAEREARWGFTMAELKAATKVATILFHNPQLFVGDPILSETRLYTMISRDRKAKRDNRETYRLIMSEERARKEKKQRADDVKTLMKTRLKQERDAALNALLLQDRPEDENDEPLDLHRSKKCHICKLPYQSLHHFYYSLCPECASFNYQKRLQKRALTGKVVLVTGCRIKIGFEICLSLLRCGATVVGTTRFVVDAIDRFKEQPDSAEWMQNVHVFALDLRDLWMVHQFCEFLGRSFPKLFAIINNAAQTIARPTEYHESVRNAERNPSSAALGLIASRDTMREWREFYSGNSQLTGGSAVPQIGRPGSTSSTSSVRHDRYDSAFELSDTRSQNSWTLNLHEVSGVEATEVMAINALAPFILNARLKPLLLDRTGDDATEGRFVINVSAMEGQFYRFKQTTHPHTNMAKAALNMMTRTSGGDYAADCIFMNSVDTGWITDESPLEKRQRRGNDFQLCPLDEVDAAARCLDLIYTDSKEHSKFWKDYKSIPW